MLSIQLGDLLEQLPPVVVVDEPVLVELIRDHVDLFFDAFEGVDTMLQDGVAILNTLLETFEFLVVDVLIRLV